MLLKTKGRCECVSLSFVLGATCHRAASQTQPGQRWTASRSACNSLAAASLLPKRSRSSALPRDSNGDNDGDTWRCPWTELEPFNKAVYTQHQVTFHANIPSCAYLLCLFSSLQITILKMLTKRAAVRPSTSTLELYQHQV